MNMKICQNESNVFTNILVSMNYVNKETRKGGGREEGLEIHVHQSENEGYEERV